MRLRDLLKPKQREVPPPSTVPLSLQVLLPSQLALTADGMMDILRNLHPSLAEARAEIYTGEFGHGVFQRGRVHWGRHMVQLALFNTPLPADHMEHSVELPYHEEELKARARKHAANIGFVYLGEEKDPLEQYLALGLIAVAMERLGAFMVVNASAFASFPMRTLVPRPGEDVVRVLRSLPWPFLFVGFAPMQADDGKGVWIRTCGAPLMGLPDLALLTEGVHELQGTHRLFDTVLHAMYEQDHVFVEGDLLEEGERIWTLRKPLANEGFLDSPRMLVLVPRKREGPA